MMKSHLFLFFFCFSGLFLCASAQNKNDAGLSRSDKEAVLERLAAPSRLREKLKERRAKRARAGGSESLSGSARRGHNRMIKEINALLAGARPKNNKQSVTQERPKAAATVDVGPVNQQRRVAPTSASLTNYLTVRSGNPDLVITSESGRDQIYTVQQAAQASAYRRESKLLLDRALPQSSSNTSPVGLLKRQICRLQERLDRLQRAGGSALKAADRRFAGVEQENRQLSEAVTLLQKDFAALRKCVTQRDQQAACDKILLEQRVYRLEKLTEELFDERNLLWAQLQDLSAGLRELRLDNQDSESFLLDQIWGSNSCFANLYAKCNNAEEHRDLLQRTLAAEQERAAVFNGKLNHDFAKVLRVLKAASLAGKK